MPCFYLTPKKDDFNKIPELQVCIAEALYDAEAVLSNPSAFKAEEIIPRLIVVRDNSLACECRAKQQECQCGYDHPAHVGPPLIL